MIEFITKHPYWSILLVYLLIGVFTSITYAIQEASLLVENNEGKLTREDETYLCIGALAFIFLYPYTLWIIYTRYRDEVKRVS